MANETIYLNTALFRVAFAHVFDKWTPKAEEGNAAYKPKFELVALFPMTGKYAEETAKGLALMKAAAATAVNAFPWKKRTDPKTGEVLSGPPEDLRNPFRDGNTKSYDGYPGSTFVRLSTEHKPKIVNVAGERLLTGEEFYSGCWAHARVNPYCYDNKGNAGVSFGLGNILFMGDDSPFGGGSAPEDDFKDLMAAGAAAPAAEGDDTLFD